MDLKKKKIAVLCGGRSREREVSLRSGKKVFESLQSQGFNVVQLDLEEDLVSRLKKEKVDAVFIMLHGSPGEDGTVQGLLEIAGIPYTGSKVLASALAMDKIASKRIFEAVGIPTPKYAVIEADDWKSDAERVKKRFPFPLVVKPIAEGSSFGVTIVKDILDFDQTLKEAAEKYREIFVEEYIRGQEVTVGVLGSGNDLQALPVLELVSKTGFYDYQAKYTKGMTEFILPARLSKPLYQKTQEAALAAHRALGCRGWSRVDIIVSADHIPYVHDVNTVPGMTELSDLPAEASQASISYDQLVLKILESAF